MTTQRDRCPRCQLELSFSSHRSVFHCVAELQKEVELRRRLIAERDERVLELEKELRERGWDRSVR